MLVWIASYPRSGNSFFRLALYQVYGHKSAPEAGRRKKLKHCMPSHARSDPGGIKIPNFNFLTTMTNAEMSAKGAVYFVKTHEPPRETAHPAIYLVRDGRDALVSYAWFSLLQYHELSRDSITEAQFRTALYNVMLEDRGPYGTWSSNVLAWLSRPNTHVVKFESLIRTPEKCVVGAVDGLSVPREYLGRKIPSFEEMQLARPGHYRRGRVGSWRDEFPADLLELFWQHHGRAMEAAGYSHDTIVR